ncbi:MAG: hypothetical protein F6J95_031935 [Leptolyngbya sp. SIO1E4]|nr:hypothetical protein [Leptolyngbya sp. SIO1E4]
MASPVEQVGGDRRPWGCRSNSLNASKIQRFQHSLRNFLAQAPLCVTIINRGWRVGARVVNGGGL